MRDNQEALMPHGNIWKVCEFSNRARFRPVAATRRDTLFDASAWESLCVSYSTHSKAVIGKSLWKWIVPLGTGLLVAANGGPLVFAQTVAPFAIVGHVQKFTLGDPTDVFSGAMMTVNGIDVVIPKNTVVVMPAAYLTPQQIFLGPTQGSAVLTESGLALDDTTKPLAAFEAALDGNIVGGVYIAGLVHISQQSLNNAAGFIRKIDYNTGELCVGGSSTPLPAAAACSPPDARVRINDPKGRYGLADGAQKASPDLRFSVDPDNPTIHSATGYPMCVPRLDPGPSGSNIDPKCPMTNRPKDGAGKFRTTFVMTGADITTGLPAGLPPIPACNPACNPNEQVPFVVGDYINFQGTLAKDSDATHPFYISAHTIDANVGIYTEAGAGKTAYISQEKSLIGTQGDITSGACGTTMECQAKIRIVGFLTDPTRARKVGIYAVDVGTDGVRKTRKLAIPAKTQGLFGRFRFEVTKTPALLPTGLGVTREIMVRIDDPAPLPDGTLVPDSSNAPTKANGLIAGQYWAPVGEYLFPEGLILGGPQPAANFQCLAFLTTGWGIMDPTAPLLGIGQLSPWPGGTTPAASAAGIDCTN